MLQTRTRPTTRRINIQLNYFLEVPCAGFVTYRPRLHTVKSEMPSNKSWAQIAAKRTTRKTTTKPLKSASQSTMIDPPPIMYQPLIPAPAMLDIKCPRCNHKNHPIVLDDLSDYKRRPGCTGCEACFPPTSTAPIPSVDEQAQPTKSKDKTTQRSDSSVKTLLPRHCSGAGVSSTQLLNPHGPIAASETPKEIPSMLLQDLPMPNEDLDSFAEEQLCPPASRVQPDIGEEDFPNVVFFREVKQKSRAVMSAELFEGSIPDDTPGNRPGSQTPVGSRIMGDISKQGPVHKRRPPQDWKRSLLTHSGVATSIFADFEEDLMRESNARMREG
jgi:hypothetical protein